MRYTFVQQIFTHYREMQDPVFADKLKRLENWYIWNLYKQLSHDILEKAADLRYEDIETNFKTSVIEKLKTTIKEKLSGSEKSLQDNKLFCKSVYFRLVWDAKSLSKSSGLKV